MAKFITELAFDFFYVMNEGMDPDSDGWKRTGAVLLMLVELGQLTRAICMEQLGWSELSETVMSYSDVVWIFTDLAQRVLPRSLFFYIALFLVVTLFGTTAYAVRLLKTSATVSKLHVKAWRWFYFVSSVLLFPSVIQWIMFPLECFVYSDVEGSMSVSADGECLPWASPQKIASIISLLLVALHILFTLAATLLLFEIHPLSRNPWAQSTGRVELIWAAFKVAVVMCSYLNVHVTSVVLSGFLLVLTTALAYMHFLLLPFNDHIANVMRGASFALLWWLSLSSVIAACYPASDAQKAAEESSMSGRETRQLILLGVSPVIFLAGLAAVLRKQSKMLRYLHLLRGDKTAPGNTANPPRPGSDTVLSNTGGYAVRKTSKRRLSLADDGARSVGSFATARSEVPKTSQEKFFDVDSEISRAFKSGVKARTFARRLLYQRDIDDVSYLSAVVNRALRENPSSSDLLVFQLQLLSFIIGDTKTADSEIARLQSQGLDLDHTFLLYSVARRSANDAADASRPGTTVNTKLEEGMKAAHSSTLGAITHMSHFWKVLRKLNKKSELAGELPAATAEEMVRDLKLFEDTFVAAEGQFASLLDKFPGTRAILQEYALFKDVCANNEREAEKLRTQAAMLETGNGMGNEEMKEEEEHARSAATSDTEKSRSLMFKFVATWSATVLGAELKTAHAIHWRVQACVFLLVAVATVGFVLSDQILFNNMVKNDIKLIRETSLFRTYTITGNFLYRSQFLAGHHNQTDEILDAKEELLYEATVMREGHHAKFKKLRWYQRDDYTTPDHEMLVPQAGRFEFRHEYVDYWTMGGDLARRLERMASMDEEEILKGGYTNESLQGNLAGIFLMENTYREIVPTIEEIMQMYEDMVTQFGHLATTVVTVNVILASVLNVAIALSVLYAVVDSVRILQHRYICCCLALSLPTDTVKKLHRFYSDQATGIRQMEDEEAEKRAIEQGGDVIEAADPDMDQDEWGGVSAILIYPK